MIIIGRGTSPDTNNHDTISLDKSILAMLDNTRPANGYPPEQEQAIAVMRKRIEDYEVEHGVV